MHGVKWYREDTRVGNQRLKIFMATMFVMELLLWMSIFPLSLP